MVRSIFWCVCLVTWLVSSVAGAETLLVTSTADSGAGSLRERLAAAQSGDRIMFSLSPGAEILLTSGQLVVNTDVTISGPGPSLLSVRRDGAAPEFRIFAVPEGVKAVIEGITIQGGMDFRGGGIENLGDYSTVARNTGRSIATLQQGSSTLLLRIRGSIVEGPWGTNSGQQTSLGYNLWLNIPPIDTHVTDMVDPSAVLDALKNNGGPTETIALSLEDQTRLVAPCEQDSGELLTVDQRGFPRPVWYGCTVGAHEPNSAWLVIPTPIAPGAECATGGQRVGAASFGASSCVIKSSALSHIISDILVLPRRPRSQRAVNVDEPGATGPGGRCVV